MVKKYCGLRGEFTQLSEGRAEEKRGDVACSYPIIGFTPREYPHIRSFDELPPPNAISQITGKHGTGPRSLILPLAEVIVIIQY